jgi:ABC-type multidrug transport system ATPase subunit
VKLFKDETVCDSSLALKGLNIDIHEGERIALIGMNGGGKSSLFKTLAMAELTPVSGKVSIIGMDLIGQSVAIGQQGILGYVPQVDSFFDFLTVDQTLSLFYDIKTSYGFDSKIEIDNLGIGILHTKYCRYPVHSLSGGNKKKLAVVAASMCNRNIILLDECTSGVDPVAAERIVTYLNDLNNTKCMLFSSHRVSECISLCNRVVILYEGRLFLEGPISCFGELSSRFYQVDITILNTANADHVFDKIVNICGGLKNIERIVQYTSTLIRMTYEKKIMAQSKLWNSLLQLQNSGLLTFSFLTMGMEETLSAIISSQK